MGEVNQKKDWYLEGQAMVSKFAIDFTHGRSAPRRRTVAPARDAAK